MKRTRIPRVIHSSFNISPFDNFNRNIIYPNVVEPYARNINEVKPRIEIIEINSDESENQCPQNNNSSWSSVKSEDETKYKVKGQTNKKRSVIREQNFTYEMEYHSEDDFNETFDSHCGRDYSKVKTYNDHFDDHLKVIDNNITPDTSSDDRNGDIDVIQFNDTVVKENPWNLNSYAVTDHDEDINKLICSLKDIKYSFESDYEISNGSFNDSTSYSTDDDEIKQNKSIFPVPIFNWIPKLNLLSSPLPTVTELTEPYRLSSSDVTEEGSTKKFIKKSANSWFDENSDKDKSHPRSEIPTKLSTSSQREKRRNKVASILNRHTENKEVNVYSDRQLNSNLNFANIENKTMTVRSNTTTLSKENYVNDDAFDTPKQLSSNLPKPQNKQSTARTNEISDNCLNDNTNEITVFDYDLDTAENSDKQNKPNEEANSICTYVSKPMNVSQTFVEPNTVPFLRLSFGSNFEEDKSCFKRFLKFMNCCK